MTEEHADDQVSRGDFAEDRTILANERTFGSWMRTSLASIALGIAFERLFPSLEPSWLPRAIASGFLLLAILIIILAERRASAVLKRLSTHSVITAKRINLAIFAGIISVAAAMLLIAIWLAPLR